MKFVHVLGLVLLPVLLVSYWYQTTAAVCPVPLAYQLGEVDPAFSLSREAALSYVQEAEAVWEDGVDRELFVYTEGAPLTIQFVYDERQATADAEVFDRETLDAQRAENDSMRQTLAQLRTQYESLRAAYEDRLEEYKARLSAYNTEVTKYNDRGGAPVVAFERLETERKELDAESAALSGLADQLSRLVTKINNLADKGNVLVNEYNQEVEEYNESYGYEREFTQGDYQTTGYITVYKFSNAVEAVTVLAHELGHALGIGHVEGTSSLMYYLLAEGSKTVPALSVYDTQAYIGVCGTEESMAQTVRRWIRGLLEMI